MIFVDRAIFYALIFFCELILKCIREASFSRDSRNKTKFSSQSIFSKKKKIHSQKNFSRVWQVVEWEIEKHYADIERGKKYVSIAFAFTISW